MVLQTLYNLCKNRYITLGAILIAGSAVAILFATRGLGVNKIKLFESPTTFNALYLISILKEGQELLDPKNTETVWEYYLLENLSCGLVRDSRSSSTGYEGCIAERFYQSDPKTWLFKIRSLNWSDGTPVTKLEIENWMNSLRAVESRHIQFFKQVSKIEFNEETRILKIGFKSKASEGLLHELSLADANLLPTEYKTRGWNRTVGPYSVKKWSKANNQLLLSANKYSPLYNSNMPMELELKELKNPELRSELFKSIKTDLVLVNSVAIPERSKLLLQNAPQIYVCHPTVILYFALNKKNTLANSLKNRDAFAQIIRNVQSEFDHLKDITSTLKVEGQMIPKGFDGRLPEFEAKAPSNGENLRGLTVKVRVYEGFEQNKYIFDLLKNGFLNAGINLQFDFSNKPASQSEDEFATASIFFGNQLDPSGSWSFLLFSPQGPIHPWLSEIRNDLKENNSLTPEANKNFFLDLHREILTKHFVVPFLVGSQRYLLSDRVDASGWNRFDSRIRFYELKMR